MTLAESIQRQRKDVLLFVDNIFRFVQAGAEISTLLGRVPSETGYQPTLASEVSTFHERIRSVRGEGSVTRDIEALLPAVDAVNAHRCFFVTDDLRTAWSELLSFGALTWTSAADSFYTHALSD